MIHSMTGFASQQFELPEGIFSIELRSVNHRYLDIQLRLSDELGVYEPSIREVLSGKLLRGKVECRVIFTPSSSHTTSLKLNEEILPQILGLSQQVKAFAPHARDLSVNELLSWPGMLISPTSSQEKLQSHLLEYLQFTLKDFLCSRTREGDKLTAVIKEKTREIENLLTRLRAYLPQVIDQYQEKLKQRLLEAIQTLDEERVRQEMLLFVQKIDIDEELARLHTHLKEVNRVLLEEKNGAGKRLDFLMQELNRETNTISAKSVSAEISQVAVQLKVLIEQIREQVQNIE